MNSSSVGTMVGLAAVVTIGGLWPAPVVRAQAPVSPSPLVGAWTLNKDLSDSPQESSSGNRDAEGVGPRGGGGGRRRGGGFGGGGFGGGGSRRGGGAGAPVAVDPQQAQRLRDAMRELLNPPDHLTIVQTETMVILTGPDGHTTRLSPDGKKIKDESTRIERKTKWDGGKLVSEISGLPLGKIIETMSVDPERHQLRVSLASDNDRRPLMVSHVYDADAR